MARVAPKTMSMGSNSELLNRNPVAADAAP